MIPKAINHSFDLGDGRTVTLETGKLARQADGSVVVKIGDTMLLASVVSNLTPKEDIDFFPLSVDYQEKFASAGRIPGGFFKREARPSDTEILTSRLVDRVLRPLFPDGYRNETQVLIYLISADRNIMPDAYAGLAASTALALSDIPFNGPISEVRVAKIDGKLVINPNISELEKATLNLLVGATFKDISMVEGEMKEVSEADMLEAIKFAHEAIKKQIEAINELVKKVGAKPKRAIVAPAEDEVLKEDIRKTTYDKIYAVAKSGNANKHERKKLFAAIFDECIKSSKVLKTFEVLSEKELDRKKKLAKKYYHALENEACRNVILNDGIRLDGRKTTDIRQITSEVGYLPMTHGSALFTRGETQSLTTVTLGTKMDTLTIDGAVIQAERNFMLHYNFPPFSTGEVKMMRGTSRREVGHGNLAQRSLLQVMPPDNPYTIRIVSDILESNGSSSMATVCAGSLALMDAGVQITKPVSGIAMGLITDNKKFAVLSDILGDEDHLGDMDFKVTGTKDGITATQMDLKVDGLPYEVMAKALDQARQGRLHILAEMEKTLSKPREDYKEHAPRIVQLVIAKEFIGAVIGPGGKIIQELQRETGTTIVIEEKDGKGMIDIFSDNKEGIDKAVAKIKGITSVPEAGEIYMGTVKSIMPYGAFVEIMPGKEGLLHISEVDHRRLDTLDGILKEGDQVKVQLLEVDKKTGKLRLSRKALIPRPERKEQQA
ncbi:MAG: polyribonucleotide nucleotidyltransferase [Bacteroidetes bacterium]|nr:polyribonucleotide nucleotidyltransferase [Bacteroidota bacterium]